MSVTDAQRDVIEGHIGPIARSDEDLVARLLESLGHPLVVALHMATRRRAQMKLSPADVQASSDRVSHQANLKGLDGVVQQILDAIAVSPTVKLNKAGEELVLGAQAGGESLTSVPGTASRRRRAG